MKHFICYAAFALYILAASCNDSSKDSAASIAQKWCDLNGKVHKATTEEEKNNAIAARKNFEKEMDANYKSDEAFKKEIEKEVNKCEDASEGR